MKITLIAVENSPPAWANSGFEAYAKRLPKDYHLHLVSIASSKRGKNASIRQILDQEGQRILQAIPTGNHIIALDRLGKAVSTLDIADKILRWHDHHQDICLLIGGPEGLSEECLSKADTKWSLSALTLPHPLVKVVVAEQLYRSWSIHKNHPYHR